MAAFLVLVLGDFVSDSELRFQKVTCSEKNWESACLYSCQ